MSEAPILFCSTTRADWGLLSPLAAELSRRGHKPLIAVGNMHLIPSMGETWREIAADGYEIAARIPPKGDRAGVFASTFTGMAEALHGIKPRCMVALGDRYEMLAAVTAAALEGVPIVHIAGGAISEGAIDDSIRHAITQLATLHLAETETYRRRIIRMGQQPDAVINTGAIGAWSAQNLTLLSPEELAKSLGFIPGKDMLLVTMHAATLSPIPPEQQLDALLKALEEIVPEHRILFTYPNNDVDPAPLIARLHTFADEHPGRAFVVPSLGRLRYHSILPLLGGVAGNSSSAIVEVPSAGIPSLDIGIRQAGRATAPSTIHCGNTTEEILLGLKRILSQEVQLLAARRENPYFRPDTSSAMASAILSFNFQPFPRKKFYDL